MAGASESGDGDDRNGADGESAANPNGSVSADDEDVTGAGRPCPACGAAMDRRHCKYVCPRHGVVYDCSDTFW